MSAPTNTNNTSDRQTRSSTAARRLAEANAAATQQQLLTQEEQREHSEENINADGYEGGEDVNSGDIADDTRSDIDEEVRSIQDEEEALVEHALMAIRHAVQSNEPLDVENVANFRGNSDGIVDEENLFQFNMDDATREDVFQIEGGNQLSSDNEVNQHTGDDTEVNQPTGDELPTGDDGSNNNNVVNHNPITPNPIPFTLADIQAAISASITQLVTTELKTIKDDVTELKTIKDEVRNNTKTVKANDSTISQLNANFSTFKDEMNSANDAWKATLYSDIEERIHKIETEFSDRIIATVRTKMEEEYTGDLQRRSDIAHEICKLDAEFTDKVQRIDATLERIAEYEKKQCNLGKKKREDAQAIDAGIKEKLTKLQQDVDTVVKSMVDFNQQADEKISKLGDLNNLASSIEHRQTEVESLTKQVEEQTKVVQTFQTKDIPELEEMKAVVISKIDHFMNSELPVWTAIQNNLMADADERRIFGIRMKKLTEDITSVQTALQSITDQATLQAAIKQLQESSTNITERISTLEKAKKKPLEKGANMTVNQIKAIVRKDLEEHSSTLLTESRIEELVKEGCAHFSTLDEVQIQTKLDDHMANIQNLLHSEKEAMTAIFEETKDRIQALLNSATAACSHANESNSPLTQEHTGNDDTQQTVNDEALPEDSNRQAPPVQLECDTAFGIGGMTRQADGHSQLAWTMEEYNQQRRDGYFLELSFGLNMEAALEWLEQRSYEYNARNQHAVQGNSPDSRHSDRKPPAKPIITPNRNRSNQDARTSNNHTPANSQSPHRQQPMPSMHRGFPHNRQYQHYRMTDEEKYTHYPGFDRWEREFCNGPDGYFDDGVPYWIDEAIGKYVPLSTFPRDNSRAGRRFASQDEYDRMNAAFTKRDYEEQYGPDVSPPHPERSRFTGRTRWEPNPDPIYEPRPHFEPHPSPISMPISPRTFRSHKDKYAHLEEAYLMGDYGAQDLLYSDLLELGFANPRDSFPHISKAHRLLVKNYESENRYGELMSGPKTYTLLTSTALEALPSTKQSEVLSWYGKFVRLVQHANIALMRFEDIELRYGPVGICIPGVGRERYEEMGDALATCLQDRLLPMGTNATNTKLSRRLELAMDKEKPNGYVLLHCLFEETIVSFKKNTMLMEWPRYNQFDDIHEFGNAIQTALMLARKRGQQISQLAAVMTFLDEVANHSSNSAYQWSAMMLKREASHLDIDDILPDQFGFRAMADYIDGAKEDTDSDLTPQRVNRSFIHHNPNSPGNNSHLMHPNTSDPYSQGNNSRLLHPNTSDPNFQANNSQLLHSHTSNPHPMDYHTTNSPHNNSRIPIIMNPLPKYNAMLLDHINTHIQGFKPQRYFINATYRGDGGVKQQKRPWPNPKKAQRNGRRRPFDKTKQCDACRRRGHEVASCDLIAIAVCIDEWRKDPRNREKSDSITKWWIERNLPILQSDDPTTNVPSDPSKVLNTYLENYLLTVDCVRDELDWGIFEAENYGMDEEEDLFHEE